MSLAADEFIHRFLLHTLPKGFHRIRHYGLLASHVRKHNLEVVRTLLGNNNSEPTTAVTDPENHDSHHSPYLCPACGKPMIIIQSFQPNPAARNPPTLRNAA